MSKRRKFSAEFKREAVQLATAPGATLRGVAHALGLNENLLSRWKKEVLANGGVFLGQGHARDQELMRLRRELAKAKKERDFLAEAAASWDGGGYAKISSTRAKPAVPTGWVALARS